MLRNFYAVKVTPKNLNHIIVDVSRYELNVDYLKDSLELATEEGHEIYAILSLTLDLTDPTFTEMTNEDFKNYFRFMDVETDRFERVVKI